MLLHRVLSFDADCASPHENSIFSSSAITVLSKSLSRPGFLLPDGVQLRQIGIIWDHDTRSCTSLFLCHTGIISPILHFSGFSPPPPRLAGNQLYSLSHILTRAATANITTAVHQCLSPLFSFVSISSTPISFALTYPSTALGRHSSLYCITLFCLCKIYKNPTFVNSEHQLASYISEIK